jgi:hypothetical protein
MTTNAHPSEDLPAYIAGTLSSGRRRCVARHVEGCLACRSSVETLTAVRDALTISAPALRPPGGADLVHAIRGQLDERDGPVPKGPGVRLVPQLLVAQIPLVRQRLWAGSALVMALGAVVAASVRSATAAGLVVALVAPVVAALGVAVMHGPGSDPRLELALATPTLPRLVVLARLLLVVGYDFALALIASAVVAGAGRSSIGLLALVDQWLGPLLLLAPLSLVVSIRAGGAAGVAVTMALWALRVLAASDTGLLGDRLSRIVTEAWSTSWVVVAVGLVLLGITWLSTNPSRADFA